MRLSPWSIHMWVSGMSTVAVGRNVSYISVKSTHNTVQLRQIFVAFCLDDLNDAGLLKANAVVLEPSLPSGLTVLTFCIWMTVSMCMF